ncbi:MAG: sigma-70 family RNA polymerase sigma factor [Kiritimatiellae bacterium]|nr:sigma-70 family RNA polymerase sigma factor [Kiritimatiellia bacterium]
MDLIDQELLADYVLRGSESAFRRIVERYGPFVYSAAYRRLGDHHLAEDAAQATFVVLAEKARTLRKKTMLGGWLWRTAGHVAGHMVRERTARARREQRAAEEPAVEERESLWAQLAPELDRALGALSRRNREAVLAHYLLGKSHGELAAELGIKADAARMRVQNGVARLRELLSARGIAVSSGILVSLLAAKTAEAVAAPVLEGMCGAALGAAAGAGAAAASVSAAAQAALRAMLLAKVKAAALIAAAAVGLGGAGAAVALRSAAPGDGRPPDPFPADAMDAEEAPYGKDVVWRQAGFGGDGRVNAIACDPRAPDLLYVGSQEGGLHISSDGGLTYACRNTGLRDVCVTAIAVHPADIRTLLLGTRGGIYKTTDRGRSWRRLETGLPRASTWRHALPIAALCFDPADPDVVYAGLAHAAEPDAPARDACLYRSADGGESWAASGVGQLPADAAVSGLAVRPGEAHVVLAATSRGVFRSTDGGANWRPSQTGLPHERLQALACAPSAPQVAYVIVRNTAVGDAPWNGGVFRSDDAGLSWRACSSGLPARVPPSGSELARGSDPQAIVVDPTDADIAYVGEYGWGTAGVYKTVDGGAHWARAVPDGQRAAGTEHGWVGRWTPVSCLAISSRDPRRLYAGTWDQVLGTHDAGQTWRQLYTRRNADGTAGSRGLELSFVLDIVRDPAAPGRLYLCARGSGLWVSEDGGSSWRRLKHGLPDAGCTTVAVDPDQPRRLWAGTYAFGDKLGGVYRSDDAGANWRAVGMPVTGLPAGYPAQILIEPARPGVPRRLYVLCREYGLYASYDGGARWNGASTGLPEPAARGVVAVVLNPAAPGHLRLACGGEPATAGVYETLNGGITWTPVSPRGLFADVKCLTAAPDSFDTLYLGMRNSHEYAGASRRTYAGGFFKSVDGGRTWGRILNFRFPSFLAVSPSNPTTLYAATTDHAYHDESVAEGVLKSADGGRTWQHEVTGLNGLRVNVMALDPREPNALYAGTAGNGLHVGRDRAGTPGLAERADANDGARRD